MDSQQDPEAIERRRAQNRIAQRKHRQRRAQILREYQQNSRRAKDGNTDSFPQDHQRSRGGNEQEHYPSFKLPDAPLYGQSLKRCVNCQPQKKTKDLHSCSLDDKAVGNSHQPSGMFSQASRLEECVKSSATQDENGATTSPSAFRTNNVVLPSPVDYISPNLTTTDTQYYQDATASMGDDEYFLEGMLGPVDHNETSSDQDNTASNQNQALDSIVVCVEDPVNPTTCPRSTSHCSPAAKTFHSTGGRGVSSRRATFTALASPPMSEDGPPAQISQLVRKNQKGKTALHLCAERGNDKIVKLLIDRGAVIDAQDSFGCTALHYAAKTANYQVVQTLLQGGADTEILDFEGYSALHVAAEIGSEDVIALLTQEGADLNSRIGMEEYEGVS